MQQYMADHPGMPEDFGERTEWFREKGYNRDDLAECMITSSCFLGFRKTKQAYRFHRDLVNDLMGGGPMEFRLTDLHLPFLDLFLDLVGCGMRIDGNAVDGAYISVVMDHGEPVICMLGLIRTGERKGLEEYRLFFASMDGLLHHTIREQIERTDGGLSGNREFTELVIRCLAYISSEKPDVQDKGMLVVKGTPYRKKQIPARVHAWDVGYRYMKEVRKEPEPVAAPPAGSGTHASPRPHMRRGHWHTYRTGPGRTERKVVWVAACPVGKGEQVPVVRLMEKEE